MLKLFLLFSMLVGSKLGFTMFNSSWIAFSGNILLPLLLILSLAGAYFGWGLMLMFFSSSIVADSSSSTSGGSTFVSFGCSSVAIIILAMPLGPLSCCFSVFSFQSVLTIFQADFASLRFCPLCNELFVYLSVFFD